MRRCSGPSSCSMRSMMCARPGKSSSQLMGVGIRERATGASASASSLSGHGGGVVQDVVEVQDALIVFILKFPRSRGKQRTEVSVDPGFLVVSGCSRAGGAERRANSGERQCSAPESQRPRTGERHSETRSSPRSARHGRWVWGRTRKRRHGQQPRQPDRGHVGKGSGTRSLGDDVGRFRATMRFLLLLVLAIAAGPETLGGGRALISAVWSRDLMISQPMVSTLDGLLVYCIHSADNSP